MDERKPDNDPDLLQLLSQSIWKELEKNSNHSTSSLKLLAGVQIPVTFQSELPLIELIKAGFDLDSSSDMNSKEARKILAQYGVILTKNWEVFFARKNKALGSKIRELDSSILSFSHFLNRISKDTKISKTPRKLGRHSARGILIKAEDFLKAAS